MELMVYFHRIYGIVPWNPLNFHGINGKNLWHFMNFHNSLLLVYLPSTAMETLKRPSEYSVDLNSRFQGFSMANLEKGDKNVNGYLGESVLLYLTDFQLNKNIVIDYMHGILLGITINWLFVMAPLLL